ncbi:hypothetical protein MKS88_000965 [Plasmodium brasilianum]|uniref:Uncharacterized protein n=1 Tax=Plasmodium brasilianum TaxID=5824 RepID=A0ACB9YFL2_PLABR|nr:hypothetical protein MKS88_000965 [Plasmodium brasilianum]
MEAIKILYLHIYEDVKTNKIRKLLEDEYGKDNVISSKDKCLKKANKLFEKYKPNVIVAYQFGCILAMHLTGPRVPMLLISPVQENLFSKRIRNEVNISDFPYIIFVHSTTDRKRNLSKSLDLIESLDKRKYRVEIVNDDFGLELISNSDYKNWVDEVYAQTKGDLKRASKSGSTIDESLFANA